MIHLYYFPTPNGQKITILLEELGIPYQLHKIDITKNEQFSPEFLKISPNNKIPALVDDDVLFNNSALTIFESGAILTYLAEKHGQFLPNQLIEKTKIFEWLYWQVGGIGPIFGQLGFFHVRSTEKSPLAINRFLEESHRLLNVMDIQLGKNTYLAGNNYSIADIAVYPWVNAIKTYIKEPLLSELNTKKNILNWLNLVGQREAVKKGLAAN